MGKKVVPIMQVPVSSNDQVTNPPYKPLGDRRHNKKTTVKTKWILKNINANDEICSENCEEKYMCPCEQNQEKQNNYDTESTYYYGDITFGGNHTAKYIQVHGTTKPETVLMLMKQKWNLEKPDLLISLYGSMTSSDNASLAKACRTSLSKAVQGTGAWIITDGKHKYLNTDVTADEEPIIIGISQWGAINNKHQMDKEQETTSAEPYNKKPSLDQHHSHFILIDDGSGDASCTMRKFRNELDSEIANTENENGNPIVLVVREDDERKIQAVIVKSSDKKASGTEKQSSPEDNSTSKRTDACEGKVHSCDFDLGRAIFHALFKDAKNKETMDNMTYYKYHLKLFEIGKNISLDTIWLQEDILETCMMAAILMDKVEYVQLILDNGFNLNKFLTDDNLEELYKTKFEGSLFNEVLPKWTKQLDKDKMINIAKHVKRLLDHVGESRPQLRYLDKICSNDNCCMKQCCAKQECCCLQIACFKCMKKSKSNADDHDARENSCLDLFVWSVLNSRQDMAKLFWQRGKNRMAAALFAHALLSALSHKIDDTHFKEKYRKARCEFTVLAIEILNEIYTKGGVNLAKKSLIKQHKRLGKSSCVMIAVHAKNHQFIAEHACQDVFNNIWMGNIDQETGLLRNNLKLLACIFFPLLIIFWVKFREEDTKPSNYNQESDHQNSNRDNHQEKNNSTDSSEQRIKSSCFKRESTICMQFKYFYQAPVVICFHNVISYMIFLSLYSYSLLSKVNRYLSWQEILLCVWVFTIFIQEVIQFISTSAKDIKSKFYNYITDGWNIIDVVTIFLFSMGMILRIVDHPQVADSALVFHGVNLITFYLRLLHIFSVHRDLGPKLVMIVVMVRHMFYFCMILAVFIVAYGIASHAILYPHTEPSFETIREIIRRPYWNIYGELMLDSIQGSPDCTNDPSLYNSGSYSRCPTEVGQYFVPLLLGVYMLMCNILLLNILIALFSFLFQKVQDNSYSYWSNQQYNLINEYANRSVFVPPVIIFYHLYQLIALIVDVCVRKVKSCEEVLAANNVFCVPEVLCSAEEKEIEKRIKDGMERKSFDACDAVSSNEGKRIKQVEKKLNTLVQMQIEILETIKPDTDFSR